MQRRAGLWGFFQWTTITLGGLGRLSPQIVRQSYWGSWTLLAHLRKCPTGAACRHCATTELTLLRSLPQVEYINLKGTSKENPAVCKYTGNRYYSDDWKHGGAH